MYQFFGMSEVFNRNPSRRVLEYELFKYLSSAVRQIAQHVYDQTREARITNPEESSKCKSASQNHHGGSVHLLLAWPRDALHLNLDFLIVIPEPLPCASLNGYFVSHVWFIALPVARVRSLCGVSTTGRGRGIPTPTTGFGDRQSSR